ncbi:MAG: hypothetical protein J5U17_01415 [Candidatus Methanoperedens sp.]|nr:hypothetical protein [Candidatus Methanoperedens sp.]
MNTYDVAIAYRIYPKFSRNAYRLKEWDKYKLSEVCLKSFLRCLSDVNFKFYAILDGCPQKYIDLFIDLIPGDNLELIQSPGIGNAATFLEQIRVLLSQNDSEMVYFAEDDYFYIEDRFLEMLEIIINRKDVDFVTPYDHPDYYQTGYEPDKPDYLINLHNYKSKLIFEKRHWRNVSSTCCTFLTTKSLLNKTSQYFKLYPKLSDYGMWLTLTRLRMMHFDRLMTLKMYTFSSKYLLFGKSFKLWSPIPSIATHMANSYFSPGVDWLTLLDQFSANEKLMK